MKEQDFTVESAIDHISKIVRQNAEGLLSCNVSSRQAEQEILKFLPQLQRFASEYTEFGRGNRRSSQTAVLECHGTASPTQFVAKSVEAIEEPIVSPELGLKGNVDMLVKALTIKLDPQRHPQPTLKIMGVELKTGHNQRPQNVHIAQLALYVVMLQTRYGTSASKENKCSAAAAESGLLLYMNNEAIRAVHIAPTLSEIKSLIGLRNLVATEFTRSARPRGVRLVYDNEIDDNDESKQWIPK